MSIDPQLAELVPLIPTFPPDDLAGSRAAVDGLAGDVDLTGVVLEERVVPGPAGAPDVRVRVFSPVGENGVRRPAVLDIHGGGFTKGVARMNDAGNATISRATGAVVVSVDYRLAPENPFPAGAEDCYAALVWVSDNAEELGVDADRIALHGASAGGGLAATTALLSRDRGGPALAMQVLVEPELDDRLDTPSMTSGTNNLVFSYEAAVISWRHYLGDVQTTPPYAAPGRAEDLTGLPRAYISVSELDCVRDEGIDYARRLLAAGVSTELHCWPGAFHGSWSLAPNADVSKRAVAAVHTALRSGLRAPGHTPTGGGRAP
jgi:acetyl esterase